MLFSLCLMDSVFFFLIGLAKNVKPRAPQTLMTAQRVVTHSRPLPASTAATAADGLLHYRVFVFRVPT